VIKRHKPFSAFRDAMLEAMSSRYLDVEGEPATVNPLADLDETRTVGPVGALIEAWAVVGDVLTFYQDRIANESALSTAHEDRSAYWIARTIGFEPRPAISARTWLAFAVGARADRKTVAVPKGTAVGNVPPPGTLPAIFETSAGLDADPAWNAVPFAGEDAPSRTKLAPQATRLVLAGSAPIAPGTALALRVRRPSAPSDELVGVIVAETTPDPTRQATLVRWLTPTGFEGGEEMLEAIVLDTRVRPFGALAPPFRNAPPAERRRYALGGIRVRSGGVWGEPWTGMDTSPIGLAIGPGGIYAITPAQLARRPAGGTWAVSSPFPGATLQTIVATEDGRLAVGTTTGQVFVSIDDGLTWLAIGDDLAARPGEKLGRYQTRRLPALPVRAIAIDEGTDVPVVFVATDRGIASIPLNGDAWTWRNDGLPGTDPKTGYASAAAVSLTFAGADGTLLAATTYGVYRSVRGQGWSRVTGLGAVSQVAALPGALVAAGPGGVFRSDDGGATWERVRGVNGVPRCLAAGVATVATAVGGDVYTSDDGGATWAVTPDALQAPVVALAVAPDGTLAAAAPVVENPAPEWPDLKQMIDGFTITLDRELVLAPGDVIVVSSQDSNMLAEAHVVTTSRTAMTAAFGMAGMCTVVELATRVSPRFADPRTAMVHVGARVRQGVPVRRGAAEAPRSSLLVARGLPKLPAQRSVAVEGLPPRIMLAATAGGTLRITPGADAARTTAAPYAWPHPGRPAPLDPDYDVSAVAACGPRGVVVARFDGLWTRADATWAASRWERIEPPPLHVTGLAQLGDTLFACGHGTGGKQDGPRRTGGAPGGVYERTAGAWSAAPVLAEPIARLVVTGGTLWACGPRGLWERRDGGWQAVLALTDCAVFDVAGDGGTVLAASDHGVFARRGTEWQRVEGLDDYAVGAVALGGGRWYAGTRGSGVWSAREGSAAWAPLNPAERVGDVRQLYVAGGTVLAAERGRGISCNGALLGAPLAGNVRGFVPMSDADGPFVLAFTGVPLSPDGGERATPVPMRTRLGALELSRLDTHLPDEAHALDAGILPPSLRSRIELIVNVKLDGAEVVVENAGEAWWVRINDALPIFQLRRGPVDAGEQAVRADLFAVRQFELARPPVPFGGGDPLPRPDDGVVCRWELSGGDPYRPPALIARPADVWYSSAWAGATTRSEIATVAVHEPGALVLTGLLRQAYDPATVRIAGNVVEATHGTTLASDEVIASGDSSRSAQGAVLAKKPLTNLLADGVPQPELTVWVRANLSSDAISATAALAGRKSDQDAVRWNRVADFSRSTKRSPDYVVRQESDGSARVIFGDAEHGRRLPTGTNNVVARYRTGGGPGGNVPANALTLFQATVAGAERVHNPVAAVGGVDADHVADLRRDVSRGIISLGRVVSQRDLADYVAAWPGVAKVDVVRLPGRRGAFAVTFANRGLDAVDTQALAAALARNGAAGWKLRIEPYRRRRFCVIASLLVRDDLKPDDVLAAARGALLDAFSFERRGLREGVQASAVTTLLQRVPGVRAVVLDALYECGTVRRAHDLAGDDASGAQPASLLVLEERDVYLSALPPGAGSARA
jgi:hypothetical protein